MATELNNLKQGDHKFHGRSLMFAEKENCSHEINLHTFSQFADHHVKVPKFFCSSYHTTTTSKSLNLLQTASAFEKDSTYFET